VSVLRKKIYERNVKFVTKKDPAGKTCGAFFMEYSAFSAHIDMIQNGGRIQAEVASKTDGNRQKALNFAAREII